MTDLEQQSAARNTRSVEVRLARAKALVEAIESRAGREDDFPGDIAHAVGWLRELAVEELGRVKAVLGFDVMSRDCLQRAARTGEERPAKAGRFASSA